MAEVIGLIPAAGQGVRLGLPYPKELYPVIRNNRYKPVSNFVVDNILTADVKHVVFVINETKHQLLGYFGSGKRFGCDISYVVQEQSSRDGKSTSPGLAMALDSAYHLTKGKEVYFGMADTIMQPQDVFQRARTVTSPNADITLILFATNRPQKFGMVRFDGEDRVLEIVDKPIKTDLTEMWGAIIWGPAFTDFLHECVTRGQSDFAEILNGAIASGLYAHTVHNPDGSYHDLGTYEEIAELDRHFRER